MKKVGRIQMKLTKSGIDLFNEFPEMFGPDELVLSIAGE